MSEGVLTTNGNARVARQYPFHKRTHLEFDKKNEFLVFLRTTWTMSDILGIGTRDERKKAISVADKVLLAVYWWRSGGTTKRVNFEEIVLQAWNDFPADFSLLNHPEFS